MMDVQLQILISKATKVDARELGIMIELSPSNFSQYPNIKKIMIQMLTTGLNYLLLDCGDGLESLRLKKLTYANLIEALKEMYKNG